MASLVGSASPAPARSAGPAGRGPRRTAAGPAGRWRDTVAGWSFVAPNLLLLVVFLFVPLAWTFVMSFQQASSFGPTSWIGLENYRRLLTDSVFWRTLVNTVVFTAVTVPLSIGGGLGLAALLDKAVPARTLLRTIIYLPIVISGLVTALIGLLMFDQGIGILNGVLEDVGLGPVAWQTNGVLAFVSVVLMTLWTRIGFAMVVYLAALQDVPRDVLDASEVDGANGWQQFRRITVPMLSSTTFFLLVMNMIWSFQVFDIVYVMTNGGPGYDTSVLVTYAYEQGFGPERDFGYGSTVGIVLFVLTLFVAVFRLRRERAADR